MPIALRVSQTFCPQLSHVYPFPQKWTWFLFFSGRPPPSVCTCSSTPARRLLQTNERMCATIRNNRTAPAKGTTKALARKDLRSSITWLSDSLSTLRSDGRPPPRKTRFRLPVRLYRTGFPPAGSLSKVSDSSHVMSCQSSPSAKLLGAIPFSSFIIALYSSSTSPPL